MSRDRPLFAPSIVAIVIGFAAIAGTLRLRSYDLFWHLATGRWIVEHRALPRVDPFRFTSVDLPWHDHGWLSQVLMRCVEIVGGLEGLVAARTLCVVGLAVFLLRWMRGAGVGPGTAALLVVTAVLGARPRLMVRPELASLVALPLLLWLLERIRRHGGWKHPAAAAVLVVVWANLHAGVLLAPPLAAAYLIGGRLQAGAARITRGWGRAVLTTGVLALATLANPAGAELWFVRRRIGSALEGLPVTNPEWLPIWSFPHPALWSGIAGWWALWGYVAIRARRPDAVSGLAGLALTALAVGSVRHQGLFFVGAALLAARLIALLPSRRIVPLGPVGVMALVAAVGASAAAWCIAPPETGPLRPRLGPYAFGSGLEAHRFPEQAVDVLERQPKAGSLFNDVAFGGYLIWRLYPARRVFIDGRNEVNPALLAEMTRSATDARAWAGLLERYGVDAALVRYRDALWREVVPRPGGSGESTVGFHTASYLRFPRERFALVYWDDVAMLFVRRTVERRRELSASEYRTVHPEDVQAFMAQAAADPGVRRAALAEIARKLAQDPDCRRAREIRQALLSLVD